MAMQIFLIGISLFRLGLCLLITEGASVVRKDAQPLKIIVHPPAEAIVTLTEPLFLPCFANYTDSDDYDNYDEEIVTERQEEDKMKKMKKTHFIDLIPDGAPMGKTLNADDDGDDTSGDSNIRNTLGRGNKLVYKWLKNGLPLPHTHYEVFDNGTLKISKPKNVAGVYQCVADSTKLNIGAVISTSCVVRRANFTRLPTQENISVEANDFVIINCPFYSVPAANVTWKYGYNNTIDFNENNRFFQLLNGSLLITNVKMSDSQNYSSSESQIRSGLLPHLQNETIQIKSGEILKLICVGYSEDVRWEFRHRFAKQTITVNNVSNILIYRNISFADNDGFYNCSTSTDFQIFNVTVVVPPTIIRQFFSIQPTIGTLIKLNCSTTGTRAKITWYKNGQLLTYNHIVTYDEPVLKIYTFEEVDKGIYQCVASNLAGEVQSTALLSWKNNKYMHQPEVVKCYPFNSSAMLIDYHSDNEWNSIKYYTSTNVSSSINWESSTVHYFNKFDGKIIVPISNLDLFQPFMFFMRGLEKTGTINDILFYDQSRLSTGIKCALQGVEIYSICNSTAIFIWWPFLDRTNINHLDIQIRYNDTSNPTKFRDQIIGTTEKLRKIEGWDGIQPKLVRIEEITNTHTQSEYKKIFKKILNNFGTTTTTTKNLLKTINNQRAGFTEFRVSGNVTGILIPNSQFIDVRVLVPVMYNAKEIFQNTTYVEWTTIGRSLPLFKIIVAEPRSITISSSRKNLMCVKACIDALELSQITCQDVTSQHSKFSIKKLKPNTSYSIYLYDCIRRHVQLGEIIGRTKPYVPGPIRNVDIHNTNGWRLEWSPPLNSASPLNIQFYEIKWTINDEVQFKNISYTNYFKLPIIGREDIFNISVRAVNDAGLGLPIYIKFTGLTAAHGSKLLNYDKKQQDPTLGILIGSILSIFCILITFWIIFRNLLCFKHESIRNTTLSHPPQPTTCNLDLHEMQTLISLKSSEVVRHSGNGNANNTLEIILLSSLTPEEERSNDDFVRNHEINSNLPTSRTPSGMESYPNNAATTFIDDKNAFQPQKIHSNNETIFPSTPPKINGNFRSADLQYSTDSLTNTSLFGSSQQQLLSTTIGSNSSNISLRTLDENDGPIEQNGDSSQQQLLSTTIGSNSSNINLRTLDENDGPLEQNGDSL